jgi:hypothetical protein
MILIDKLWSPLLYIPLAVIKDWNSFIYMALPKVIFVFMKIFYLLLFFQVFGLFRPYGKNHVAGS